MFLHIKQLRDRQLIDRYSYSKNSYPEINYLTEFIYFFPHFENCRCGRDSSLSSAYIGIINGDGFSTIRCNNKNCAALYNQKHCLENYRLHKQHSKNLLQYCINKKELKEFNGDICTDYVCSDWDRKFFDSLFNQDTWSIKQRLLVLKKIIAWNSPVPREKKLRVAYRLGLVSECRDAEKQTAIEPQAKAEYQAIKQSQIAYDHDTGRYYDPEDYGGFPSHW